MSDAPNTQPPGWYHAKGDPAGTQRYWDGNNWKGGPQPVPGGDTSEQGSIAAPAQRIIARAIDGIVWVLISIVVAIPFGVISGVADVGGWLSAVGQILAGLAIVLYEIWMVSARGGTFGKLVVGLRVVAAAEAEPGGEPDAHPSVEMASRRMALLAVHSFFRPFGVLGAVLFGALAMAGLVMLFIDPKRQTPWDKIGKTVVQDV